MSKTSIPIILLGRLGEMGRIVSEHLQPEIETIHFIASPETAHQILPALLAGKKPSQPTDDDVGSQDYSRAPQAVISGMGYPNEVVDELRVSCQGVAGGVPWFRGGLSKAEVEHVLATNPPKPPSEQGPVTAEKIKKLVLEVVCSGRGADGGVYKWY